MKLAWDYFTTVMKSYGVTIKKKKNLFSSILHGTKVKPLLSRPPIKWTPSVKQVLSLVPKQTSDVSLYNEPLFSRQGNEFELWMASLATCNFITVQSNRWMLNVQFLKPLLSGHPLLSRHLGRSRRCPLNRVSLY